MNKWISVKYKLPTDYGYYLIICDNRRAIADYCPEGNKWYTLDFLDSVTEEKVFKSWDELDEWTQSATTHWMPLPEAPHD
jgi:hypothetical protein